MMNMLGLSSLSFLQNGSNIRNWFSDIFPKLTRFVSLPLISTWTVPTSHIALSVSILTLLSITLQSTVVLTLHASRRLQTLSVEFAHTTGGGKPALRSFMESRGYTVIREVRQADWTANDFIFIKNGTFSGSRRRALARVSRPWGSVTKFIFIYGVGCRKKLHLRGVRCGKNKMLVFE